MGWLSEVFFLYKRQSGVFFAVHQICFQNWQVFYNWQDLWNNMTTLSTIRTQFIQFDVFMLSGLEFVAYWIFKLSIFTWNVNIMKGFTGKHRCWGEEVLLLPMYTPQNHIWDCLASLRRPFNQISSRTDAVWAATRCLLVCWKLIFLGTSTESTQICQKI